MPLFKRERVSFFIYSSFLPKARDRPFLSLSLSLTFRFDSSIGKDFRLLLPSYIETTADAARASLHNTIRRLLNSRYDEQESEEEEEEEEETAFFSSIPFRHHIVSERIFPLNKR